MDLLKTPSVQSLLDSDIESVASIQSLDIEELDESEYALPPSEAPTLAEVMRADDDGVTVSSYNDIEESNTSTALQVDLLQAISQQLTQAQERSSAGAATSLSVGVGGKLTVGTAHGHMLTFQDQVLRWVCDANEDRGAVSCLSYSKDGTRILAGYARGLVCQYDSLRGIVLRRVVLGGELWGILQVTWAGTTGLALDTGGSVWLMKFLRPLGVRSARTSCLFSGARGEVVAMAARDARILALATLSRIIVVAGGRAAGVRFNGPPDTLPVLTWSNNDERILICARAAVMQWLSVTISGTSITLRPIQRFQLKSCPLWLGWLSDSLAIFDSNENLSLWGNNYEKPLDLSDIEPVYASAFFKGLWTDGRVSRAMCMAGASALGGACVEDGALSLLGRRGVVRVRQRDLVARARTLFKSDRRLQAMTLLCSTRGPETKQLAIEFVINLAERSHLLNHKDMADRAIKLCLIHDLRELLWGHLWDQCSNEEAFVEAIADSAARGELDDVLPSPDITQALIEKLADFAPELIERVVASLPLTNIDPHRASTFAREKGLWRAVGAIAATLGGASGAIRELCAHVRACGAARGAGAGGAGAGAACACGGDALLLAAADGLAGRAAAGRALPEHARPSARHDALQALLSRQYENGEEPLRILLRHDARSLVHLLEQSARDPPFVGPLGKQNRLRVARALLSWTDEIEAADGVEILEFITAQLNRGALPSDREIVNGIEDLAARIDDERSDRAWLALLERPAARGALAERLPRAAGRPRVAWRLSWLLGQRPRALELFQRIPAPTDRDFDELFERVEAHLSEDEDLAYLESSMCALADRRPRRVAAILMNRRPESVTRVLESISDESALEFGEYLIERSLLSGEAAVIYFRRLCARRPDDVVTFLSGDAGIVRPEDALRTVRELGPRGAEPICLENAGDARGALDVTIELFSSCSDEKTRARLIKDACELCTRVASSVPTATAMEMWTLLLQHANDIPASLLLDAIAYLPVESLISHKCDSPQVALTMLECASSRRTLWECAMRIVDRELHEALFRALHVSGGAVAVHSSRCVHCSKRLATQAEVRVCHCGGAVHVSCQTDLRCRLCLSTPASEYHIPRIQTDGASPPLHHNLSLVAPPRPDLEGIV